MIPTYKIGQTLKVDGKEGTVIGIMKQADGFSYQIDFGFEMTPIWVRHATLIDSANDHYCTHSKEWHQLCGCEEKNGAKKCQYKDQPEKCIFFEPIE